MEPNKAFKEYKDTQEQIKQMCIEYFLKPILKHQIRRPY